jgi:MoaE-MoaD fusion protein
MASASDSVSVTVRFFAAARERTKVGSQVVRLPSPATVQQVIDEVVRAFPALAAIMPQVRIALNQEFTPLDASVPDGAEVALIPPVAGGQPLFAVVDRPLSLQEVVDAVHHPGHGGLVTFTGAVRDHSKGKRVTRLEYEAYVPMAEKKLREIAQEARAQWAGVDIAIVHRVGTLQPGELAVVIAVSTPHRKEAFRACEFVIDRLKQDVPIWKKEFAEDGEVWVGLGP